MKVLQQRNNGSDKMIHVFIVGSKGIPARYGGFETFVENLTARRSDRQIQYHISCMNNDENRFEYNGADCFNVSLPLPGAPGRILHVSRALRSVERWCQDNPGHRVIVYILGCRIGPLLIFHSKRLRALGVKICCNPDGLEWKRGKWNRVAKRFLKYCERCLVCNSDLVICDSLAIETYIHETYGNRVKKTTYIAYGADLSVSTCPEGVFRDWCHRNDVMPGEYYLSIGRFVPENNLKTVICEYMASSSRRDLVIVSNVEHNRFYEDLLKQTDFQSDRRIKFAGTEYNTELVNKIRENAFAYIHGHEVGGTNPSLLEAMASTQLNLLLDVPFNREVAEEAALYWDKRTGSLSGLIRLAEALDLYQKNYYAAAARERISKAYDWENICRQYESLWLKE